MNKLIALSCILLFVSASKTPDSFDVKKLEKDFINIHYNDLKSDRGVYACKFELTNAQYNLFLEDIKKSGNISLYNSCQRDSLAWKKFDFGFNEPLVKYYANHPAYKDYPVVCISYESALAYCNWLTNKYKESGKGKYKDVVFRLPTIKEWVYAAHCSPQAPYPWYGSYPYGQKGCYYCNIRCDTINWIEDGAFYPVKISSYFPNKLGLYNLIGNVSEMLSEKGIAMGGSWYNFPEEVAVQKQQRYNSADPGTGVRIFMEVKAPEIRKSKQIYAIY